MQRLGLWWGHYVEEFDDRGGNDPRASAPGYNTVERSLFPKLGGTVEAFVLDRQ